MKQVCSQTIVMQRYMLVVAELHRPFVIGKHTAPAFDYTYMCRSAKESRFSTMLTGKHVCSREE